MAEVEERMPMDTIDEAPVQEQPTEQQEQRDQRARDDAGRFAPKPEGEQRETRGQPNAEAARRREAQERDDARREAKEAKEAHAALQKRLDDMSSLLKGEDAPEDNSDPLKPVLTKLDALEQRFTREDEERQAQAVDVQVREYADADERRFVQQQPDFPQAVSHYITSRVNEMQALGLSQPEAEAALTQEAQTLLYQSAQNGRSPAETIFAMARARGYQSGQVIAMPRQQQAMPETRATGGRSLGTGGGPAGGAMTAAQIAAMDEADYLAFRSTPEGKRAITRAMGG